MGDIKDSVTFLIVCEFNGITKRYAEKDLDVEDKHFEGKIISMGSVGTSFNLLTFSYSMSGISVEITNEDRLQDEEPRRVLDGQICKVYAYSEGMTWADVESKGLLYTGTFKKDYNCKRFYGFTIEDATRRRMRNIPETYINEDNFPIHRKEAGGGSVSGKPVPVVFGDFGSGVPLLCTHTSDFKYAVCLGIAKSLDSEYTATTENVYDKDGDVIAAAGYTFYPGGTTEAGPYSYFDFSADQVDSENLSCSIRGIDDGDGEITGTVDQLIEHPAHIYRFIIKKYGIGIDPDLESIGTMKALLPNIKMAAYINAISNAADVCSQRILMQCLCSMIIKNGKYGVAIIAPDMPVTGRYEKKYDHVGGSIQISKTDIENVCNSLTINYALNVATGQYEEQYVQNRTNNSICNESYYLYGERPNVELNLPDIRTENGAITISKRYLSIHAFRHDVVPLFMTYSKGYSIQEGDAATWTIPEGSSGDGNGWVNEKLILLDRTYTRTGIQQRWWRVQEYRTAANISSGAVIAEGEGIQDAAGDVILDAAGDPIQDAS